MKYESASPEDYISQLPEERKEVIMKLRQILKDNLPAGFQETMSYGMITYVVPHQIYPPGYHVNPDQPLPFVSIASQKNFIALYHMGLYMVPGLLAWFKEEYPKHVQTRLDMGKSCMRFKKTNSIPYDLIAQLSSKITVDEYVRMVEAEVNRAKKN
ncbi:DUF1801 domain-containing protein [Paenibacillus sp. P46E]|uniref:DUF1801 domain-containing protein n=1 Tax=Paenibacillus sp. P46E TaxID=1349436 RepID=UPI00093A48E4|nr:DUF1801 domain-containing protein [Paenibacillus sp. P46E]OKP98296.1 hypothetical protein A3849_10860 [Paenibacillus sp. P46E]